MTSRLFVVSLEGSTEDLIPMTTLPFELGAQGVEIRDHQTHGLALGRTMVLAWHALTNADDLRSLYAPHLPAGVQCVVRVDEMMWSMSLHEEAFLALGGRFRVVSRPDQLVDGESLLIEPGLGFGDGQHPTTQACATQMTARADVIADARVLDIGTGTGILAIMAALLGASHVQGTDIDSVAREAARENALRNGLSDKISVSEVIPEDAEYEVVVANLYFGLLPSVMPAMRRVTRPGAHCLISGFTSDGVQTMVETMKKHDFTLETTVEVSGWVCLDFLRISSSRSIAHESATP